jgi:outer membrane lipoprotein SlyB
MTDAGTAAGQSAQLGRQQSTHVIGVYESLADAQQAVERLLREGVRPDDVSIVGNLEHETAVHGFVSPAEAAKEGAGRGAVVGGLFGLLAGTAFFFVPGVGPLVVLGPLASALVGAGEGALTGGIFGAILGKIMEKQRIPRYEQQVKDGKYLVVVRTDPDSLERIQEAVQGTAATEVETEAVASTARPAAASATLGA